MYITSDEPRRDFRHVTAIEDGASDLKLYDYVLIEQGTRKWIGQITAPNINISPIGSPFDPAILYAIKLSQSNPNVQLAETIESWQITLQGEYENDQLRTLRRRPKPGAKVTRLDREMTIGVLRLSSFVQIDGQPGNVIGYLLNADDVPLCVSEKLYTHHMMVSGGTGSGKSNTGANLISQAARLGFTVFLYDAKPDYRKIGRENSDKTVDDIWRQVTKYGLKPAKVEKLTRVAIYGVGTAGSSGKYQDYDYVVGFRASDFDPYLFAGLFFDERSDLNQYEEFASVCFDLRAKKEIFTIKEILEEVAARCQTYLENEQKMKAGKEFRPNPNLKAIHPSTAEAIKRKVDRIAKNMSWLDSVGTKIDAGKKPTDPYAQKDTYVKAFSAGTFIGIGGIVHIDCANLDARSYALFLARFIDLNQKHLTANRDGKGVVEFVDEAHRIFSNVSKYSDMLATTFNRAMIEGRSLKHGVIISLQNASQVPANVLNNVNTHIVMRQNNREVAKVATQIMESDFTDLSLTLSTGQALCKMFESKAVLLAQMAPSPYELERSDNAGTSNAKP